MGRDSDVMDYFANFFLLLGSLSIFICFLFLQLCCGVSGTRGVRGTGMYFSLAALT